MPLSNSCIIAWMLSPTGNNTLVDLTLPIVFQTPPICTRTYNKRTSALETITERAISACCTINSCGLWCWEKRRVSIIIIGY